MPFAALRNWFTTRTRWEQAALLAWSAILLFVCVRVYLAPDAKTVYPIFSSSARLWWAGADIYDPHRPPGVPEGYRYSPTCTILFTPFALFPDEIGGVAWRLFNVAALGLALLWFVRAVLPTSLAPAAFAGLTLLLIPLTLQSLNNGQANHVVTACLLGAVASAQERRWTLASVLLAGAFACKVYPLALGMALIVLYPRPLGWRLPAALAGSLIPPFLCQDPTYVIDQYEKWLALLRAEDRSAIQLEHMYRDLWLLIHIHGVPMSRSMYTMVQIAAGIGVAGLCWQRQQWGWSERAVLTSTLALVTAWTMLLGPATESSSFVLLAPSLAWSILEAVQTPGANPRRALLWASAGLLLAAVVLGGFASTVKVHTMGIHAWGSLAYFLYLLTEPKQRRAEESAPAEIRRAAA